MKKLTVLLMMLPALSVAMTCPTVAELQSHLPAGWTATLTSDPYQPVGEGNPYQFQYAKILEMFSGQHTILCHYTWSGQGVDISLFLTRDGKFKPLNQAVWSTPPNSRCVQGVDVCSFINV